MSAQLLRINAFSDVFSEEVFTDSFDLVSDAIMSKTQFVKDTQICSFHIIHGLGHEVWIQKIFSVLQIGIAVDIVTGGQEQVIAVDEIIGDAGVGGLHSDEQSPTEVKQFSRSTRGSFALP